MILSEMTIIGACTIVALVLTTGFLADKSARK